MLAHLKILFILFTTIVKWLFQNYVLFLLIAPRSNKGTQKHDEIFQNDVHCTDVDTEQTVQTVVRIFTGRHEIYRKWFFCPKWTSRVWQRCFGAKYQFLLWPAEWKAPAPLCNRNNHSCLDARLSNTGVFWQVLTFWQIAKKQNGQKGRVSTSSTSSFRNWY